MSHLQPHPPASTHLLLVLCGSRLKLLLLPPLQLLGGVCRQPPLLSQLLLVLLLQGSHLLLVLLLDLAQALLEAALQRGGRPVCVACLPPSRQAAAQGSPASGANYSAGLCVCLLAQQQLHLVVVQLLLRLQLSAMLAPQGAQLLLQLRLQQGGPRGLLQLRLLQLLPQRLQLAGMLRRRPLLFLLQRFGLLQQLLTLLLPLGQVRLLLLLHLTQHCHLALLLLPKASLHCGSIQTRPLLRSWRVGNSDAQQHRLLSSSSGGGGGFSNSRCQLLPQRRRLCVAADHPLLRCGRQLAVPLRGFRQLLLQLQAPRLGCSSSGLGGGCGLSPGGEGSLERVNLGQQLKSLQEGSRQGRCSKLRTRSKFGRAGSEQIGPMKSSNRSHQKEVIK